MSGYTPYGSASYVDMGFLRERVQDSLNNGVDDDEASIRELIQYFTADLNWVEVEYMPQCGMYSIWFSTLDAEKNEYQYRLFVKSHRSDKPLIEE